MIPIIQGKRFRALALMFVLLQACAQTPKRAGDYGPPAPFGPQPPTAQPAYGPELPQTKPLFLVLGPGAARSFAYAGVLRALHDLRIPVGGIVATETGALIGALYGLSGSINRFEWGLLKLKRGIYDQGGSMLSAAFSRGEDDGSRLEEGLKTLFGDRSLEQSKTPLRIGIRPQDVRDAQWVSTGKAVEVLRAAGAIEGVIKPGSWESAPAYSSLETEPYPVGMARTLGFGVVVVIDVASDLRDGAARTPATAWGGDDKLEGKLDERIRAAVIGSDAQSALEAADLVITPDLKGFGLSDFSKRSEAAFRGKAAIQARADDLRRLIGQVVPEPAMRGGP